MQLPEILPIHVGAAPLIRGLIDKLRIVESIDEQTDPATQSANLSVGTRIQAMIIQILTDRKALYRMEEWYAKQDIELLLGPGITAKDLNDDALSRALDHFYKMDFDTLYSQVSLSGRNLLQDPDAFRSLHVDTTSLSLYGKYDKQEEEEALRITYGFSKDHRPDLKQIQFGLVCSEGLPVYGDVHDGNTNDGKWNLSILPKLKKLVEHETLQDLPLVGDSAFVTTENLNEVNRLGLSFLSRLPERYALAERLKNRAVRRPKAWEDAGRLSDDSQAATYRIQSMNEKLNGRTYRFLVVQSSALDKRKEKTMQRELDREKKALEKAIREEEKKEYTCKPDAHQARLNWLEKHPTVFSIKVETVAETVLKRRRGRPRKEEDPSPVNVYRNRFTLLAPDESIIQERRNRAGSFVLITNLLDPEHHSNIELLKGYKEQYRVEQRFRFLKSPYFVGPMYFQRPQRVQAFSWVMLLALLVYSYLQQSVRTAMKKEEEPLILPGKRKSYQPTGLSILELLEYEQILQFHTAEGIIRQLPPNAESQLPRLLRLLQLDEDLYTQIKESA